MFRKLQLHQPCSLCCPPNLLQCPGERAQLWGCCRNPEVKPHFGFLGTWARSSFGCSALGETGMSRNCAAALQCRWAAECPCQGALFSLNEVLWLNTRPLVSFGRAVQDPQGMEMKPWLCCVLKVLRFGNPFWASEELGTNGTAMKKNHFILMLD